MRYFVAQTFCIEDRNCSGTGWSGFSIAEDGKIEEVVSFRLDEHDAKRGVRDMVNREHDDAQLRGIKL